MIRIEMDLVVQELNNLKGFFENRGYTIIDEIHLNITKKTKLNCIDSEGYKFYISFESIRNKNPLRFSPFNPYVIHNIDNYTITNREGYIFKSTVYTKASDYNLEWICPHGHIFKTSWQVFQNNYQCVKCTKPNRDLTKEEFIELLGTEYELLDEYINASTNVKLKHSCGHTYDIQPSRFIIKKPKCKKCSGYLKKTTEQFIKDIYEKYGKEYEVLGEYKTSHDKIKVKHVKCQTVYDVTPTNILSGKRCPNCCITIGYQFDFNLWLENNLNEYIALENYNGVRAKIKMKHLNCNTIWSHSPYDIMQRNARCPVCTDSNNKSEKELGSYIVEKLRNTEYNVKFQHWFSDCRGKNKTPYYFDYAVFDKDDKLLFLIERHGEQHYNYIKYFHKTYDKFIEQLKRDKEKELYCFNNNINLHIVKGGRIENRYLEYEAIDSIVDSLLIAE